MAEFKKMGLESEDLVADRIEQLKRLFPEIVTERAGGGVRPPTLQTSTSCG